MATESEYEVVIYPTDERFHTFSIGDTVTVFKGKKATPFSRAKVTRLAVPGHRTENVAPAQPFPDRLEVKFLSDGSIYHVREEKAIRVEDSTTHPFQVIVCSDTYNFRRLAGIVRTEDKCLDIGCSFGATTSLLFNQCKRVCGIDKSEEHIVEAKKRYPHVDFQHFDAFLHPDRLAELGDACDKVFIDINGNRLLPAVERMIDLVKRVIRPKVIVVKSSALVRKINNSPFPEDGITDLSGSYAMFSRKQRKVLDYVILPQLSSCILNACCKATTNSNIQGLKWPLMLRIWSLKNISNRVVAVTDVLKTCLKDKDFVNDARSQFVQSIVHSASLEIHRTLGTEWELDVDTLNTVRVIFKADLLDYILNYKK